MGFRVEQFFRNLSPLPTQLKIGSSLFNYVIKCCFYSYQTGPMHADRGNILHSLANTEISPLQLARLICQKVCSQEA